MHTQKQIPCANAQQSTQTPTIYGKEYHSATIHAQLNPYYATGIAGLLTNAPLLAIAETCDCQIDESTNSLLQSYIQSASNTLGDVTTALSFAMHTHPCPTTEYITPQLVAEFAALVGELLPVFTQLSENINTAYSNSKS